MCTKKNHHVLLGETKRKFFLGINMLGPPCAISGEKNKLEDESEEDFFAGFFFYLDHPSKIYHSRTVYNIPTR